MMSDDDNEIPCLFEEPYRYFTEYGHRGAVEIRKLSEENRILKETIKHLQEQLDGSYEKIKVEDMKRKLH